MLYLDMDGCFADFPLEMTKLINLLLSGETKTDSKTLNKAILKAHSAKLFKVSEDQLTHIAFENKKLAKLLNPFVYKLAAEDGYFRNLEIMNKELFNLVLSLDIKFKFLSAPIGDYSVIDKRWWLDNVLGVPEIELICIDRKEKFIFAKPGCVLIDDHPLTIKEWNKAGGTGFLCPNDIDYFIAHIT